MHHAYTCTTRCGCAQQTAHSEARFNTAARQPQSVPQTGPLEAIEEWSGQQRAGGGLEGEPPALPARGCGAEPQKLKLVLQSERHYLGQDDRNSTNASCRFLFCATEILPLIYSS